MRHVDRETVFAIEQRGIRHRPNCDRAALARHKIDIASINAAVPAKRTSYSLLLQKLLFQARLKYQLRIDDGNRPFIWITTIKK